MYELISFLMKLFCYYFSFYLNFKENEMGKSLFAVVMVIFLTSCGSNSGSGDGNMVRPPAGQRYVIVNEQGITPSQFMDELNAKKTSLLNFHVGLTTLKTSEIHEVFKHGNNETNIDCTYTEKETKIITEINQNEIHVLSKFQYSNLAPECEAWAKTEDSIYVMNSDLLLDIDFSKTKSMKIFKGSIAGQTRYSVTTSYEVDSKEDKFKSTSHMVLNLNSSYFQVEEQSRSFSEYADLEDGKVKYEGSLTATNQLKTRPDTDVSKLDLSKYPIYRYDDGDSNSSGSSDAQNTDKQKTFSNNFMQAR